jgi:diguanylate cyclase (GGDEF)-like protein
MVLRLQRFSLASATSLFMFALTFSASEGGLLVGLNYTWIGFEIGLAIIVFYIAIRSDFSLRFKDPSLTVPQILVATVVCMQVIWYANEARGAFLIVYLLAAIFGIFRLDARLFMRVGFLAVIIYGVEIAVQWNFTTKPGNLIVDILQWLVLAFLCPWFAYVGEFITTSRRKLRDSNDKLAKAMREVEAAMLLVQEQAIHDELTGLYNRRYLLAAVDGEVRRAERSNDRFCVLLLDIDHFKRINDTFGHLAGDHVLTLFSQAVSAQLRVIDCFGRYGGEEFVLLMPQTDLNGATLAAERLRCVIEQTNFDTVQSGTSISVSIGVAEFFDGESVAQLIARADLALYSAKNAGRNKVVTAAPPNPIFDDVDEGDSATTDSLRQRR